MFFSPYKILSDSSRMFIRDSMNTNKMLLFLIVKNCHYVGYIEKTISYYSNEIVNL